MNDRELLELAAKAAGLKAEWKEYTNAPPTMVVRYEQPIDGVTGYDWNPLEDDGDALRLAARIGMIVDVRYGDRMKEMQCHNRITYWVTPSNGLAVDCNNPGSDNLGSIRRAIVRAAAEIGRRMP